MGLIPRLWRYVLFTRTCNTCLFFLVTFPFPTHGVGVFDVMWERLRLLSLLCVRAQCAPTPTPATQSLYSTFEKEKLTIQQTVIRELRAEPDAEDGADADIAAR